MRTKILNLTIYSKIPKNPKIKRNQTPEMIVNDYGSTKDSTVVIEEEDRTVMLTENETIVIEKSPKIDIVPKNRPRKVYGGMWGQAEIATVGLSDFGDFGRDSSVSFRCHSGAEGTRSKTKRSAMQIEAERISRTKQIRFDHRTQTQVGKLVESVNDFETQISSGGNIRQNRALRAYERFDRCLRFNKYERSRLRAA